jgi:hypothetical protein
VKANVALRTEWRAKDDEILSDARVDDVHHRIAPITPPALLNTHLELSVLMDTHVGIGGGEIGEDVRDHA